MIKSQELSDPNSCLNRAADDEMVFVLRARDPSAPDVIRDWCIDRCNRGLNQWDDTKIQKALQVAETMENQRRYNYAI